MVGQECHAALEATGGVDSVYTWSVAAGSLPPGLTVRAEGTIIGTPTQAGASEGDSAGTATGDTPSAESGASTGGGSDVSVLGGTATGSTPLAATGVAVRPTLAGGGLFMLLGVLICAVGVSIRRRSVD